MKQQTISLSFFFAVIVAVLLTACGSKERVAPELFQTVKEAEADRQAKLLEVKEDLAPATAKVAKADTSISQEQKELVEAGSDRFILMDFNSGGKPNNLGGDLGAWDRDPSDASQTCEMIFEPGSDALNNPNGYALRLNYDVESDSPAFNGFWAKLEGEDFSSFENLNLYVKGDAEKGFTPRIKIEIKDFQDAKATYLLRDITAEWKRFTIPFKQFAGASRLDLSAMNEFVIVFDDQNSKPKVGSILIDEISVS